MTRARKHSLEAWENSEALTFQGAWPSVGARPVSERGCPNSDDGVEGIAVVRDAFGRSIC